MAALHNLTSEAAWRREWDRRIRSNHVCNICGYARDLCVCADERENYAPAESEGAPE